MSGIVGLWNFDGAPVQLPLLQHLSAALQHRGPDATGFWTDGPVGMAACLLRVTPESLAEVQPVARAGEAVVVFDGRLDNREEILAAAQDSDEISSASPDSALVLAAYRQRGEKFVERLNGDFALALFDIPRRQLMLARDYLGVRPLYYARAGGAFLFASEIKAILAYPGFPRVPNEGALAVFLAHGFSQDAAGETLFSGVYSCPPAHLFTVTPQKTLPGRYRTFEKTSAPRVKSSADFSEGFRWYFEQAVRRRLRSAYPVAVSLSGGLDSSSVFCVAETIRRNAPQSVPPIVGVSLNYPDASPADEKQFLAEIERMYGVTIARVLTEPALNGSGRYTREGIWHVETPLMDSQWNDSHVFYKTVAARGARVVLTGHWGDQVLDDQSHLVDLFNRLRFAELWARLRGFPHWMTDADPHYVQQQFLQDLLRYQKRFLPEFVVRSLRRLRARHHLPAVYSDSLRRRAKKAEWQKSQAASPFASFHAQSLCTKLASGYYFSCLEELNKVASMHGMEIAFPFVDRDVVGFVMATPPEVYSAGAVPRAMLRQEMRGVVPDAILDRRWKADFSNHINESMSLESAGIVSSLLGASKIVERGFVNRDLLGPELDRLNAQIQIQGSTCEAAWDLQKLCRLEMWLQVFFSEAGLN
jgi:asparagine synthase (glutamine-hydrolysing)